METTSTSIVFNNKYYKVRPLLPAALFCCPLAQAPFIPHIIKKCYVFVEMCYD